MPHQANAPPSQPVRSNGIAQSASANDAAGGSVEVVSRSSRAESGRAIASIGSVDGGSRRNAGDSSSKDSVDSLRSHGTDNGNSGGVRSLISTSNHSAWRTAGRRQKRVIMAANTARRDAVTALLAANESNVTTATPLSAAWYDDGVGNSVPQEVLAVLGAPAASRVWRGRDSSTAASASRRIACRPFRASGVR